MCRVKIYTQVLQKILWRQKGAPIQHRIQKDGERVLDNVSAENAASEQRHHSGEARNDEDGLEASVQQISVAAASWRSDWRLSLHGFKRLQRRIVGWTRTARSLINDLASEPINKREKIKLCKIHVRNHTIISCITTNIIPCQRVEIKLIKQCLRSLR